MFFVILASLTYVLGDGLRLNSGVRGKACRSVLAIVQTVDGESWKMLVFCSTENDLGLKMLAGNTSQAS
jgi:hypothetical protein